MLAGAAAALTYTLRHLLLGVDIDFIPHEPAAEWFVAAFGWAGLATALVIAGVPGLRTRLRRELETAGREPEESEPERPSRPRRVA